MTGPFAAVDGFFIRDAGKTINPAQYVSWVTALFVYYMFDLVRSGEKSSSVSKGGEVVRSACVRLAQREIEKKIGFTP